MLSGRVQDVSGLALMARVWEYLVLAGDQSDGVDPTPPNNSFADVPAQQPQRQAEHARRMVRHPLDRGMGLPVLVGPSTATTRETSRSVGQ